MKKIFLTKGQVAILDDDDFEKYGLQKWHVSAKNGYYYARGGVPKNYLHHLILGRKPTKNEITIFLNNNTLDLRKQNILYGYKPSKTSKYRGVTKLTVYYSRVVKDGKTYCKYFGKEDEAAKWYNEKATELFGDKVKLNVVG